MNLELFITPDHTLFTFQPEGNGFQVTTQRDHAGPNEKTLTTHYLSTPMADQLRFGLILRGAQIIE
jgi:hypothetical protein